MKLEISQDDSDTAYLYLPDHPGKGKHAVVTKQVRLFDVIKNYNGPDVYIDIDDAGKAIGIEILA